MATNESTAEKISEGNVPEIPDVKLNSGYSMPLVGFGTYKIVGQEAVDKCVDAALAAGYRHFDTAKLYKNEAELGAALERFAPKYGLKREQLFITTKFYPPGGEDAAAKVAQLVEESLANLRTPYLDLVLIHYPKAQECDNDDAEQNAVDRRETWLAMEALPTEKVRSIGVSNYEPAHLAEMATYAKRVPAVNQVEYHPHFRRDALRACCAEKGIFFQAFSSLARMHPDLVGDPVVVGLAEKHHASVSAILLAFATCQGVGIVPKSESAERIRTNLDCLRVKLSEAELAELNAIPRDVNYIRTTPWLVK